MARPMYVRFDEPKALMDKLYEAIELSRDTGKLKKGTNEVTKIVERGQAILVVMAMDVQPEEILAHLPMLCEEKRIPYGYATSKQELGKLSGLDIPTAAIAVVDPGKSEPLLDELTKKLDGLKK